MTRWWRAYSDARHDPKLMLLPPDMFRAWFVLLCLAAENDGKIRGISEVAFALRVNESKAKAVIGFLAVKGLLDPVTGGYYEPHNWERRQYKSDVSNERVKRFRDRKRNDDVTLQKRPQIQSTDTEKKDDGVDDARARADGCTITPEAFELCDDLMRLQRLEKDDPRCIASAYAVQAWLTKGWKRDIIRETVDIVMSKRTEAPAALRYFEKAIAAAHAEHERPLPIAEIQEEKQHVIRETLNGREPRRRRTMLDVADELAAELAEKRDATGSG